MQPVSVIVRAKDKASTIEATIDSIRRQTVAAHIIVVDSGSTDATLDIARARADRVIEIPPGTFSYGRALNLGAAAAAPGVHVALSAHCVLPHDGWLARAVALLDDPGVGAACGREPDGAPREPFLQDLDHARAHPWWGFSNHASAWRSDAWLACRFDEELRYAEDKEWALRVLATGRRVAFDDDLYVPPDHQWNTSVRDWVSRQRRSAEAISSFTPWARYGVRDAVSEWWNEVYGRPVWRARLNPGRAAGITAKWLGFRAGRGRRRRSPARAMHQRR